MRALVVLNGDQRGSDRWLAAVAAASDLIVAADGAAAKLDRAGVRPHLVVGDLDSIAADLRASLETAGVAIERHPTGKDRTDAELAIAAAVWRGADVVRVVGAFGGDRIDHAVANLLLLALADFAAVDLRLDTEHATIRRVAGPGALAIDGVAGDYVTLEPLSEVACGVRSDGLRYPLRGEDLVRGSSRGVSNELIGPDAKVELRDGLLLVAIQRRSVPSG
ncbi:MAG TPA: thiamine diphosphokinase [Candidatus Limnocylindria bacterium]|nr:thiamine diphosphokinase [Candidatus Limnocylindria bacterium]